MAEQNEREKLQSAGLTGSRMSIAEGTGSPGKKKSRSNRDAAAIKRRCVSTACIACRKRKSKCDGNTPSCAACSSVYGTECVYDPNSDHRRKGVYREKFDNLKMRNSTLQTLIQAILNASEDDVLGLVKQIRTCESLDDVAESIARQEQGVEDDDNDDTEDLMTGVGYTGDLPTFETELSSKMGELRIENGSIRFIGGTSNLIYLSPTDEKDEILGPDAMQFQEDPITSWTNVIKDPEVVLHLINMYFSWHYPYFTTLSKNLFYQEFLLGKPPTSPKRTVYCSSLLVNAMLALGCHFTNSPAGCADPKDPTTKGDAFFHEAKRLIVENDEYEKPKLTTIQALALMSVREAGCGREAKGWVYSGMSFRMALDMGLNLDSGGMTSSKDTMDEKEIDARRITFWGCFLFDKCWSNYLGRLPQLPVSNITVPKYDVFPDEEFDTWSPYTDNGVGKLYSQPSRTRAVALQISNLCEISGDLLIFFYHPQQLERSAGKSAELKKLSEFHTRLEAWRRNLPKEFEPKEGQLPNVILMHMFFHLLYIHLFRPFLKYSPSTSPLPSHVSPRKFCSQAASLISKLMRLYKRTYGLRQVCNIAVYMIHSACTIHLLNLPDKAAKRDIAHGVKHLEEIAEDWLCARRTLSILSVLARKWNIELPEEAGIVLARTDAKYGTFSTSDVPSPKTDVGSSPPSAAASPQGSLHVPSPLQQPLYYPRDRNVVTVVTSAPSTGNIGAMSGGITNAVDLSTHLQNALSSGTSPTAVDGGMHVSPDNNMRIGNTYQQQGQYSAPASRQSRMGQQPSSGTPTATLTRQVSPSMMFGGVDALVESQDWWLKDQTSLALGFDNWGGLDPANGATGGISSSMPGISGGYFMPVSVTANVTNNGFGDDDWYT